MPFEVLPAVDVAAGRLARLSSGGPVFVEAFGGDPLAATEAFLAAGARWVHVVDLDRALKGETENGAVIERISRSGARVQASGGIVDSRDATEALARGAERVVLSSRALEERASLAGTLDELGDAIVVGLEIDGDLIRPRGGGNALGLEATLSWLAAIDVRRYLATDLARFGALTGPDVSRIEALGKELGRPLLAAGGISSSSDIRALAGIGPPIEGAIVGRALYEGDAGGAELLRSWHR